MQTTGTTRTQRPTLAEAELDRGTQDNPSRSVERDQTSNLISSDKVEKTAVYNADGEKIGHIDHLMIGKRSGRVEYSVMSFGGFLGIGESYHPVPWDALDYDTNRGGYVVDLDREQLETAPSYRRDETPAYDSQYGQTVYGHYGLMY